AGTFEAIIPHLDRLVELGVTALELMPVAEFPGSRNWGYDGVHLFAPQSTYGGPHGLRRLVDACHARGLAVFLDVVYNHLGPEGNYLAEYGPYFTARHSTPWGPGVNYDGPGSEGVRRHVIENGRMWVREFHIDGFRLDAIHAIHDASPTHILTEFAGRCAPRPRGLAGACTSSPSRTTTTGGSCCRRARAASASTRSGRTISTTRCIARSPGRRPGTTWTSASISTWSGRSSRGSRSRASRRSTGG